MENTSGQGSQATVPAEIDKWNWGACLFNWIWGIGNNTLIALLMFIPFVNFVMFFVLGVKGSSWAWRNKKWESVEHFKQVQHQWAKWSLIVYGAGILCFVGLVLFGIFLGAGALKSSDAFKLASERLEASEEAVQMLGTPISTGSVSGSVEGSGPSGKASISFSASGPKSKGTVSMEATKKGGNWEIGSLALVQDGTRKSIDLDQ